MLCLLQLLSVASDIGDDTGDGCQADRPSVDDGELSAGSAQKVGGGMSWTEIASTIALVGIMVNVGVVSKALYAIADELRSARLKSN